MGNWVWTLLRFHFSFSFFSLIWFSSRWVRAAGPSLLHLLLVGPSNITKQLSSSRERPSCPGWGWESRGTEAWRPLAISKRDWHAPFLLQVFIFSLGLQDLCWVVSQGMMVGGEGVRCEDGAWQSLFTAQNLHAVTRWQHPPLLLDDRATPSHPWGAGCHHVNMLTT